MERMLLKIARQLNGMDEASLMALWPQYLSRVQEFDGSQEWEDAAVILSLVQAVRSKNQLFNLRLAERQAAAVPPAPKKEDIRPWRRRTPRPEAGAPMSEDSPFPEERSTKKPANILQFRTKS